MKTILVRADFNGLFDDILCLSHEDTCFEQNGEKVLLREGLDVTAFEENYEGDKRDDLIASGTVKHSPAWLQCNGSKWILKIDENGVRYQSETQDDTQ